MATTPPLLRSVSIITPSTPKPTSGSPSAWTDELGTAPTANINTKNTAPARFTAGTLGLAG
jgi:hypothetical protein